MTVETRGMLIDGEWSRSGSAGTSEVRSPYDGSVVGVVPKGGPIEMARAVAAAKAALARDDFPRPQRIDVLERAAVAVGERVEELARIICLEAAKPIRTARVEAARAVDTFRAAAAVARTASGEMVPLDAVASAQGKLGFTLRVPISVVAAISPFNFPLNLVAHKLEPAIAAGCPVRPQAGASDSVVGDPPRRAALRSRCPPRLAQHRARRRRDGG